VEGKHSSFTDQERGEGTPGKGFVLIILYPPECMAQGVLELNLDLPQVPGQKGEQHTDCAD
jgi:hypothetical protein